MALCTYLQCSAANLGTLLETLDTTIVSYGFNQQHSRFTCANILVSTCFNPNHGGKFGVVKDGFHHGNSGLTCPDDPIQVERDSEDCKADCPRYKLSEGYEIVGGCLGSASTWFNFRSR